MRQEVNFYSFEFKSKKIYFSFYHGILIIFLLIILFLLATFFLYKKMNNLMNENSILSDRYDKKSSVLASDFDDNVNAKKILLEKKISILVKEIEIKNNIKKKYKSFGGKNNISFHNIFISLSKKSSNNMSISEIAINNEGKYLAFKGFSKEKESVPNYINQLNSEEVFNATDFGLLRLTKLPDKRYYQFEMLEELHDE